jgi:VCBS repeat-containing protein
MRSTRPVLLGLAAGGALALSAAVAIPAYAAPSNTPPVANDDAYSTAENANLAISAPGVLSNDLDADGDAFSAQLLTGAQHGTVSLNPNGAFTYIPNQNYAGPDQFTYQICEQFAAAKIQALPGVNKGCDGAVVRITIKGVTTVPPTTTPTTPPPAGVVYYRNCAEALNAVGHPLVNGIDAGYRIGLDRDRDGTACEANEGPAPVVAIPGPRGPAGPQAPAGPSGSAGTGSGPSTVVIVPPAPSGSNYGQIGQAPAGAASTGFGPNA